MESQLESSSMLCISNLSEPFIALISQSRDACFGLHPLHFPSFQLLINPSLLNKAAQKGACRQPGRLRVPSEILPVCLLQGTIRWTSPGEHNRTPRLDWVMCCTWTYSTNHLGSPFPLREAQLAHLHFCGQFSSCPVVFLTRALLELPLSASIASFLNTQIDILLSLLGRLSPYLRRYCSVFLNDILHHDAEEAKKKEMPKLDNS